MGELRTVGNTEMVTSHSAQKTNYVLPRIVQNWGARGVCEHRRHGGRTPGRTIGTGKSVVHKDWHGRQQIKTQQHNICGLGSRIFLSDRTAAWCAHEASAKGDSMASVDSSTAASDTMQLEVDEFDIASVASAGSTSRRRRLRRYKEKASRAGGQDKQVMKMLSSVSAGVGQLTSDMKQSSADTQAEIKKMGSR